MRKNKKESIAALHEEAILAAAEKLFLEKGVTATTIDDISKDSDYSRRTIYTYYKNKDHILYHIILKGLLAYKEKLHVIVNSSMGFMEQYWEICSAMREYKKSSPQSASSIENMKTKDMNYDNIPPVILEIFAVGRDINNLLLLHMELGIKQKLLVDGLVPMQTVYVMSESISALITLTQNKGELFAKEFSITNNQFLEYGLKQIINSILKVRI